MPFVQRIVEPKFLSRTSLFNEDGKPKIEDKELEAVTNNTLSNALRQLASILLVAEDIFTGLGDQLKEINKRSEVLKIRINNVDKKVSEYDPKKVSVPESDICTFAQCKEHYTRIHNFSSNLFSVETRPESLKALYSSATKTPVLLMRHLDRWRRDGLRSSKFFSCTPVLGQKRRRIKCNGDIEIETSVPAAVGELRRWTSSEAMGDITVTPDCPIKIPSNISHSGGNGDTTDGTALSDDEAIDHKLPSPEEQVQVVSLKFPSEIVAVDVSGKAFDRMSFQRRSLMNPNEILSRDGDADKKKTRTRRPRSKRRNTLAGTDQKEIQDALVASEPQPSTSTQETQIPIRISGRSKSSDILRTNSKKDSPEIKKPSHFNTLKQWGKNRYEKLMNRSNEDKNKEKDIDEFNLYETVTMKRRRNIDKKSSQHRSSSVSSSEKSSNINIPVNSTLMNLAVKLRESSLQRRERRKGKKDEQPHSSSGNWSASSESGRNSIGSEITTSTAQPKSTSATTSNNSLNFALPSSVCGRRKFLTSGSSSVTSEGTLTPDIIHDLHEDGETSSVYSCDTEGYYTSFHVDSGLKTLKEEELPPTPLHCSNMLDNDECDLHSAENEYELFGKGSTSTTTSSAGTICTTLKISEGNLAGPAVPERKSSLKSPGSSLERDSDKTGTVKRSPAMKLENKSNDDKRSSDGGVSPDSGHNTSSSPIESTSSANGIRSGSEFEFSESSDMEGAERIERIRVKTTINSSRIPSMCVITPNQSDDESTNSNHSNENNNQKLEGTDKFIRVNKETGYATLETIHKSVEENKSSSNFNSNIIRAPSPSGGSVIIRDEVPKQNTQIPIFKSTLLPLNNVFDKIKTNLSNFKTRKDDKSPNRNTNQQDDLGEYVTITDVKNNNNTNKSKNNNNSNNNNKADRIENTYVNDIVNKNLKTILSGNIRETEYVSLNELPNTVNIDSTINNNDSLERKRRNGARVTLDAEGKVVYSSDSLKRKKGPQSTFEPGPFVKTNFSNSSPINHRNVKTVRAVTPTMGRVIIRANSTLSETPPPEVVRVASSIIGPTRKQPMTLPTSPTKRYGAYVKVQDASKNQEEIPRMTPEIKMYQSVPEFNQQQYEISRHPGNMIYDENPSNYYMGRGTQYQTLPAKKTQMLYRDFQPERSVTPDITRGLEKLHPNYYEDGALLNQQLGIPSYLPSSPSRNVQKSIDDFRISPIDPRSSGSFKSSTPSNSQFNLKAAMNLDNSMLSPKKSTMSNEELYAVIHKSKKKMNIKTEESSPVGTNTQKPNENIQQIEKMKTPESGYLNDRARTRLSWSPNSKIAEDINEMSPSKENFLSSRTRQSWASPSKDRKIPQTSRLDFKKLLLQKSTNILSTTKKPSAVEQLKLSKQQIQAPQNIRSTTSNHNILPEMNIMELSGSPRSLINRRFQNLPSSPTKNVSEKPKQNKLLMSPNRSQWRFPNPRSDVLSSTILEDCREEDPNSSGEKKISPKIIGTVRKAAKNDENVLPISQRLQAKRAEFFGRGFSENDKKTKIPALETSL